MSGFGGSIKLTGEDAYQKALRQITQNLREVSSEMKVVSSSYDKNDKSTAALTAKEEVLNKKLTEQENKLNVLNKQYEKMSSEYAEQTNKHNALVKTYDEEKNKLEQIGKELGTSSKEYQEQKAKVDALSQEVVKSTKAQDDNEKSMSRMRVEINNAQADCNKTAKEIDKLGDEAKKSGKEAEESSKGFEKLKSVCSTMGKIVAGAVAAVGAAAVAGGKAVWNMANSVSKAGDEIDKNSQKVGLSYESYQKWDYALKLAGTSMANCETGLKTLTNKIDAAKNGTKSAEEAFERLGISVDDLKGKSREEIFDMTITALQNVSDETERAALASKMFGKSGQDLLPILNQDTEATQKALEEAEEYGMVMSDEAVKSSAAFQDSLTKLKGTLSGVKNNLMGEFLPSLTKVVNGFSDLIAGNDGASDSIKAGLTEAISTLTEKIPDIVNFLTIIGQAILESAPTVIEALASGILTALPTLIPTVTQVAVNICSTLLSMTPQIIDVGMQILIQLIQGLNQALPQLIQMLPTIITTTVSVIMKNLPLILSAGITLLVELVRGITKALPQLIAYIPTLIKEICNVIEKNLPQLLVAGVSILLEVINGIIKCLPQLVKMIPTIIQTIVSTLINLGSQLIDAGGKILSSLMSGISSKFGDLKQKAQDIAETIMTKVKEIPTKIVSIGTDIVKGIWNGISNGTQWIKDKIKEWVGNVTNFIKKVFKIGSPSKLMEDEVGQWLAKGIGVGFEDEMNDVASQMADAIPTNFDIDANVVKGSAKKDSAYGNMVAAFKQALSEMKIELDSEVAGQFVDKTVSKLIYT